MKQFEHLDRIVVKRQEFERLLHWVEDESNKEEKSHSVGISLQKDVIEYEVGKDRNPVDLSQEATVFHHFKEKDETIYSEVFVQSGPIFTSLCTYEANAEGITRIIRMVNRPYAALSVQEKEAIRAYAYNRDKGKCRISRRELFPHEVHIHHISPNLPLDQVNKVPNLATVHKDLHPLIHSTEDYSHLGTKAWRKIRDFREKLTANTIT